MSKSTKSALLSALIFPGAGHLYLKCYKRGFILLTITVVALVILIKQTLERVSSIIAQMEVHGHVMSTQEISEMIANSPNESFNFAVIAILICWVYGIIDSARAGKQQDVNSP